MAAKKRLIDAIALISKARRMETTDNNGIPVDTYAVPVLAIEDAPTVDAVEVVRCKDCYHNEQCICVCCEDGEMIKCGLHHKHMDANGYCHEGRRC